MTSTVLDRHRLLAVFLGLAVPSLVVGRVAMAVAVAISFICFLTLERRDEHWRSLLEAARGPLGILIVATFLLWLPNVVVSPYPVRSLEAAARSIAIVGVLYLLWSALRENQRFAELCLKALVVSSVVAAVIAILAMTAFPELYWGLHLKGWRSTPLKTELKSFAAACSLLVPVLLWAGYRLGGRWLTGAVVAVAGLLARVWMTYNRAAIAGFLAMAVVIVLAVALTPGKRPLKIVLSVLFAVALVSVLVWLKETRTNPELPGEWLFPTWLIDYQRQEVWGFTLDLIGESPWVGRGINTINFVPGADTKIPGVTSLTYIPSHPHNWFLESLAETGIVGTVPLLAAIAVFFGRLGRHFFRDRDLGTLIALSVAAVYWGSGLFNFSFWSVWWQASFALLVTISLSVTDSGQSGISDGRS